MGEVKPLHPLFAVTNDSIMRSTGSSRASIEGIRAQLKQCDEDELKSPRRKKRQCKLCFYLRHRMGGNGITHTPECHICREAFPYGSTARPKICKPCADKHNLCAHCCADRELKRRPTKRDLP